MKKKAKWFEPGKELNWRKELVPASRRRLALESRGGDPLKTGRALQALSNVTKDKETKMKAGADARYFYSLAKKTVKVYAKKVRGDKKVVRRLTKRARR